MYNNINRNFEILDAQLLPGSYKNFSGAKGPYNQYGQRKFNLIVNSPSSIYKLDGLTSVVENQEDEYGNVRSVVTIDGKPIQEYMNEKGWNVKPTKPRDPEDPITYFVEINVAFNNENYSDPDVRRYTNTSAVKLTGETVGILDSDEILKADLVIRPRYSLNDMGGTRIKGYLREGRFTVYESEIAQRYTDLDKNIQ